MSTVRRTIAIAVVLCLGLGLYFVLQVERGGRPARVPVGRPGSIDAGGDAGVELDRAEVPPASAQVEPRAAAASPVDGSDSDADRPRMRVLVRDGVSEAPIAGALVTLFDCAAPLPLRTDGDGVCFVPEHAPEEPARLRVEAAGHFHSNHEVVPTPYVNVVLDRAASMSGHVLAADTGAPVAGAEISLRHDLCDGCEPERVRSGADGGYELSSVPLRRHAVLDTRAADFAPAWREFVLDGDEPRVVQDIHLARGIEIAGHVEDWVSGQGVAGAKVGELVTDGDGHFHGLVLPRAATGARSFVVHAPGYAALRTAPVSLHDGELVFRLPRLAFLEGQVNDSSGQPVPRATISFVADGPNREAGETSPLYELAKGWSYVLDDDAPERSDGAGHYRTAVLPWSLNGTATAGARGFAPQRVLVDRIGEPGSVRRIDWMLQPGEAKALVRGSVTLDGQQSAAFQGSVSWRGPTRSGSALVVRGCYETEVEAGSLRLSASLDILPGRPSKEVLVNVDPASERSIDLDVEAPAATITGTVRFAGDGPVAGAYVFASCPLQASLRAAS